MENKFKKLSNEIIRELRSVGIHCYAYAYNKFNNSIYIQIGYVKDTYNGIRLSDHTGGNKLRFSLRSDIKQSKKFTLDKQEFLWYTLQDIKGMLNRIKKEYVK